MCFLLLCKCSVVFFKNIFTIVCVSKIYFRNFSLFFLGITLGNCNWTELILWPMLKYCKL